MESLRDLTIKGKIIIIKAQFQSQMVYLWSSKLDKIKYKVLYEGQDNGGITLPIINCQNKLLNVVWIQRMFNAPHSSWVQLATKLLPSGKLLYSGVIFHKRTADAMPEVNMEDGGNVLDNNISRTNI